MNVVDEMDKGKFFSDSTVIQDHPTKLMGNALRAGSKRQQVTQLIIKRPLLPQEAGNGHQLRWVFKRSSQQFFNPW